MLRNATYGAIIALVLLIMAGSVLSETPQLINYQGRLTDDSGNPLDTTVSMVFTIYDAATDGNVKWTETHPLVTVTGGLFNVTLGDGDPPAPISDTVFNHPDRYLGITIGSDPELDQRTHLTSVGYSHRVSTIDGASGGYIEGEIHASDSIIVGNTITIDGINNRIFSSSGEINFLGTHLSTDSNIWVGPVLYKHRKVVVKTTGLTDTAAISATNTTGTAALFYSAREASGYPIIPCAVSGSAGGPNTGGFFTAQGDGVGLIGQSIGSGHAICGWAYGSGYSGYFEGGQGLYVDGNAVVTDDITVGDFNMPTGASDGYVLTSDAAGAGTWQPASGTGNGWVDDGAVVRLETSGDNVGIGTPTPGEKLDVDGNIHASGTISSGSSVIIDGAADQIRTTSSTLSFEDDTLVTLGQMRIGTGDAAPYDADLYVKKDVNLSADRRGVEIDVQNAGIGSIYGLVSTAKASTPGMAGFVTTGVMGSATSDGIIRKGVDGWAQPLADTLYGITMGVNGGAYRGEAAFGVYGESVLAARGYGCYGTTSSNDTGYAVYGEASDNDYESYGVYGAAAGSPINWAGYFSGNVNVTGTLSKGGGSFKIDHPLDPENKYLYHSFVESPDMMNVYNGNVFLDNSGEAIVELPDYFEALNKDFRYQLCCIGGYAPVYIAEKIANNQFRIAGGTPGLEVSWQVTGIRKDAFAEANRIPVEEYKKEGDRGKYLHPEAFGLSPELYINYERENKIKEMMPERSTE